MQKSDLDQIGKLVRKIVREEVKTEVKDSTRTIESQIRLSRMQVQQDIGELDDRMKNVEIRIDGLEEKVSRMHKDLKKEIKMVSHVLDKENMQTLKRVTRMESHLGLPQI